MKPIKSNKLKVGDWIVNQGAFSPITKEGKIQRRYNICQIERIVLIEEGRRKGKEDIHVKCWDVEGNKVTSSRGNLGKMDKTYLLNKNDLIDRKKQIILISLE
jgi:hypothetical protein